MRTGGMLMPAEASRFRISFSSYPEFCQQVQDCNLDLLNKRLVLKVRQSVLGDTFAMIVDAMKSYRPPQIEVLSRYKDGPCFVLTMMGGKLVKHDLLFDYGDGGPLMHHLEWEFDDCVCLAPEIEDEIEPVEPTKPIWPTPSEIMRFYDEWKAAKSQTG
jgi:hypothetical protein